MSSLRRRGQNSRRMLKRAVQQGAASEEARRTLQYVEPLNDARTPLTDFFSRLLGCHDALSDNMKSKAREQRRLTLSLWYEVPHAPL